MRALFLALLLTTSLLADTYAVVKITYHRQESISTTYRQGLSFRFDGPNSMTIHDAGKQATWSLDPHKKQYVELKPRTMPLFQLAQWIMRPRDSGKTVNIYDETVDTGERKDLFGYTARHIITRERQVAEPGACSVSYQTETDGWYITVPGEPRTSTRIEAMSDRPCHDNIIRHGEQADPGFAVLTVRGDMKQEVLSFSTAPLDPKLFEVPAGFTQGPSPTMSWTQEWSTQWNVLKRAIQSWFD
jgi:hypothetical protein